MSRYITKEVTNDIIEHLGEWEKGIYGRKLTWDILAKGFGYTRQALSGNSEIKAAFDKAKAVLKGTDGELALLAELIEENTLLKKKLEEADALIHRYEQKYIRWQINAQAKGISVDTLNKPVDPNLKEEMRKMQER